MPRSNKQLSGKFAKEPKDRTKKGGNKIKLFMILKILQRESNPDNPLTREQITAELKKEGILCERRTFGNDMKLLESIAHIKECKSGRKKAYYVSNRDLNDTEIKILIDAVQAASFLSPEVTELFVKKLANIGGHTLSKRVADSYLAFKTRKRSNDEIWDSVECIRTALYEGKQISFVYNDRNIKKEWVPRNNGDRYFAEPLTLYINDDRYYVVCYGEGEDNIIKYRVDRMTQVEVEKKRDISQPALEKRKTLPAHLSKLFSMYSGPSRNIVLNFRKELAEMIFDNFGEDLVCEELEGAPDWARVIVRVSVASTFFGWLANYRGQISIESPKEVLGQYERFLRDNLNALEAAKAGKGSPKRKKR